MDDTTKKHVFISNCHTNTMASRKQFRLLFSYMQWVKIEIFLLLEWHDKYEFVDIKRQSKYQDYMVAINLKKVYFIIWLVTSRDKIEKKKQFIVISFFIYYSWPIQQYLWSMKYGQIYHPRLFLNFMGLIDMTNKIYIKMLLYKV